jgi:hypothetical protein
MQVELNKENQRLVAEFKRLYQPDIVKLKPSDTAIVNGVLTLALLEKIDRLKKTK